MLQRGGPCFRAPQIGVTWIAQIGTVRPGGAIGRHWAFGSVIQADKVKSRRLRAPGHPRPPLYGCVSDTWNVPDTLLVVDAIGPQQSFPRASACARTVDRTLP